MSVDKNNQTYKKTSFLSGVNSDYIEENYALYLQNPKLLKEYLGKRVSLESMIILDSILGFSHTWNVKLEEDYAWKDVCKLMENYKSFLKFDETKFKFVLKQLML